MNQAENFSTSAIISKKKRGNRCAVLGAMSHVPETQQVGSSKGLHVFLRRHDSRQLDNDPYYKHRSGLASKMVGHSSRPRNYPL